MTSALQAPRTRRVRALLGAPADGPLSQRHVSAGLGGRAARGAAATLGGQWLRFVLQTASTVALARLLTPHQYGLVGMVTAITGIGDIIWTLGLSTATIQRPDITRAQVNAFFWLQAGLGLLLTLVTVGCAPLMGAFYRTSAVVPLTSVLAVNFLLGGLAAQHLALLSRQMRFFLLALIDVVGLAAGLAVALLIAVEGGGPWALVGQLLTLSLVRIAVSWPSSGWWPGRPRKAAGMRPVIGFGLKLGLTNSLNYVSLNADNVLLGRFYGAAVLGLYARAYNLLLLPVQQIHGPVSRVAVPVLSYLQHSPERFRRYFMMAMTAVCYASLPILGLLAALTPQVVALMLGPRWSGVTPIFRVLALTGALTTVRYPNGWLFVATGRTGRQAAWALVNRPVIVASFVAGLPWGATGVAWGLAASTAVLLPPSFAIAVKGTPVRLRDVWLASYRPLIVGVATFGIGTAARLMLGTAAAPVAVLALAGGLEAALLGLLLAAWPAFRQDLARVKRALLDRAGAPQPEPGPLGGPGAAAAARG